MNLHIQDSLVENYQSLIPLLALSDQNDRHVLAAAICARGDVIITFNLSDFPPESLEIYGIEAQHPDEFISHLIDLAPPLVYKAIQEIQTRLKNPPRTINELLTTYENLGLNQKNSAPRGGVWKTFCSQTLGFHCKLIFSAPRGGELHPNYY